ncbi:response regulator [Marinobacterium jannaschii]|uniref:response regulator n=1 Tax=Marinobacterium jannaschii TaxID=64970 RepID=UPI0004885CEC|nr:response regulator [Marinobacterium jannaschii]
MQPRILLIEDDEKLTQLLSRYLEKNGFEVVVGHNGGETRELISRYQPDLLILDLMLPGLDGLSACREVRPLFSGKIMILTASDDDMDQVAALEMGADDFVCKPLQPRVLLARIRMLLRRLAEPAADPAAVLQAAATAPGVTEVAAGGSDTAPAGQSQLSFGELRLDQTRRRCLLAGEVVGLTPGEFDLFWLLADRPGQPLSRDQLVKLTRGIDYDGVDRTIDNKIAVLRRKLADDPARPNRIITVRGKGYMFVPDSW